MFVLTQDRLNMDLDRDSLELMLNLLEIDAGIGKQINQSHDFSNSIPIVSSHDDFIPFSERGSLNQRFN